MRHKLVWVSVPFQFNWYQHVGPLELSTFILNVQPVIPLKLNDDWNLILRIIVRSSASRLCLTAMPRARAAAVPDRTRSLITLVQIPQCSRRIPKTNRPFGVVWRRQSQGIGPKPSIGGTLSLAVVILPTLRAGCKR